MKILSNQNLQKASFFSGDSHFNSESQLQNSLIVKKSERIEKLENLIFHRDQIVKEFISHIRSILGSEEKSLLGLASRFNPISILNLRTKECFKKEIREELRRFLIEIKAKPPLHHKTKNNNLYYNDNG